MNKRRFSVTTLLLVLLLIGILFAVGKLVNPLPPGPPAEPVAANPSRPSASDMKMREARTKMQAENAKKMAEYNRVHPVLPATAKRTKPTPGAIDISSEYFRTHPMGDATPK